MIKKIFKKLIRKKNSGQSELISSLFVITALLAVLFFSIGIVQDLSKIQAVDQIARQSVIKLETQGKLTSSDISSIKNSIVKSLKQTSGNTFNGSASVNGTTVQDGVYMMYKNAGSSSWVIDTTNTHTPKYGEEVAVYIQCEVYTTGFRKNIFGGLNKTQKHQVIRQKASITKAST